MFFSLYFLVIAAKWMLDGAISIAKRAGLSPLIIGSTIVAFGTILPSIAVNIAILLFSPQDITIAVGNMLGTNYVNLGLALGIPAFMTTIITKYNVFEKEIPLYLSLLALFTVFAFNQDISQLEGLGILVAYLFIAVIVYQYARREKTENKVTFSEVDATTDVKIPQKKAILLIILGLIFLILSSFALVYSAPLVAAQLGISSYIVGLTVVGIGTSLPTIVASIEAAKRNDIDIVLGNVFGGNLINIGLGAGLPALFHNIPLSSEAMGDLYFTTVYNFIILLCILVEMKLLGGHKSLSKISGLIIIAIYVGYIIMKVVSA
jgi:cation:H+ antiporter